MNKKIEKLKTRIEKLKAELKTTVADVQRSCKHEDIYECDYSGSNYGSLPPIRVCGDCGMTEEGWGPGYWVLKTKHPKMIARNQLYDMRTGLVVQDEHKGRIIRKEVTVAQLIDEDLGEDYDD